MSRYLNKPAKKRGRPPKYRKRDNSPDQSNLRFTKDNLARKAQLRLEAEKRHKARMRENGKKRVQGNVRQEKMSIARRKSLLREHYHKFLADNGLHTFDFSFNFKIEIEEVDDPSDSQDKLASSQKYSVKLKDCPDKPADTLNDPVKFIDVLNVSVDIDGSQDPLTTSADLYNPIMDPLES